MENGRRIDSSVTNTSHEAQLPLNTADFMIEKIKYLSETEAGEGILVPLTFGNEFEVKSINDTNLQYSEYFKKLFSKLPDFQFEGMPKSKEELDAISALREELLDRLGVTSESTQIEHMTLSKDDMLQLHEISDTNIDGVFYHHLHLEFAATTGSSFDFFTVGLSKEDLDEMTKESGANDDREAREHIFNEAVERQRKAEKDKQLKDKRKRLKKRYSRMTYPDFVKHAAKTFLNQ